MRTPVSAFPSWPNGFDDGFGCPLPFCFFATALAAGFFTASFTTFFDFAAAFLTAFFAGFAAFFCFLAICWSPLSQSRRVGKGAEGALPTRTTSFELRSTVFIAIDPRGHGARTAVRAPLPTLRLLLQLALRIEVADAAALAAGCRIDHRVDEGWLAAIHRGVDGALELVGARPIDADAAERLHHLVVARAFHEHGWRGIRTHGIVVGAPVEA